MAYVIMAYIYGLYSYGLDGHGPYSYGPYSYLGLYASGWLRSLADCCEARHFVGAELEVEDVHVVLQMARRV